MTLLTKYAKGDLQVARNLVTAAMGYQSSADRCNAVYMGSMATASVYHALGLRYGDGNFSDALSTANEAKMEQALKVCQSTIDYMQKHPVKRCECCGQIVPGDE